MIIPADSTSYPTLAVIHNYGPFNREECRLIWLWSDHIAKQVRRRRRYGSIGLKGPWAPRSLRDEIDRVFPPSRMLRIYSALARGQTRAWEWCLANRKSAA